MFSCEKVVELTAFMGFLRHWMPFFPNPLFFSSSALIRKCFVDRMTLPWLHLVVSPNAIVFPPCEIRIYFWIFHLIYNNSWRRFRNNITQQQNKLWNELTICFCFWRGLKSMDIFGYMRPLNESVFAYMFAYTWKYGCFVFPERFLFIDFIPCARRLFFALNLPNFFSLSFCIL